MTLDTLQVYLMENLFCRYPNVKCKKITFLIASQEKTPVLSSPQIRFSVVYTLKMFFYRCYLES